MIGSISAETSSSRRAPAPPKALPVSRPEREKKKRASAKR
jgi:hypothetical protein